MRVTPTDPVMKQGADAAVYPVQGGPMFRGYSFSAPSASFRPTRLRNAAAAVFVKVPVAAHGRRRSIRVGAD